MALVHQHLVVAAQVEYPLTSYETGVRWLETLVARLGMQALAAPTGAYCHTPGNRGLTLLLPITTSHLALHIWDEICPATLQLDVYSCRQFDPELIYEHLQQLKPVSVKSRFLDRDAL